MSTYNHRDKQIAKTVGMIAEELPDSGVYWANDGQRAVVVATGDHGQPYIVHVDRWPVSMGGEIRTESTAGDGWRAGWEAQSSLTVERASDWAGNY